MCWKWNKFSSWGITKEKRHFTSPQQTLKVKRSLSASTFLLGAFYGPARTSSLKSFARRSKSFLIMWKDVPCLGWKSLPSSMVALHWFESSWWGRLEHFNQCHCFGYHKWPSWAPHIHDWLEQIGFVIEPLLIEHFFQSNCFVMSISMDFDVQWWSFLFTLQREIEARKFFDIILTKLEVSILEFIIVQNLKDFISHERLELWKSVIFREFKQKGAILKNKTWNQQTSGEKAFKCVVYR